MVVPAPTILLPMQSHMRTTSALSHSASPVMWTPLVSPTAHNAYQITTWMVTMTASHVQDWWLAVQNAPLHPVEGVWMGITWMQVHVFYVLPPCRDATNVLWAVSVWSASLPST